MFGVNSINGSVQWLGVRDFLRTDGPPWSDNLLGPDLSWVDGGTTTNQNWVSQHGGTYGIVVVPCSRPVPVCQAYVRRSPENACAAARRVRDDPLLIRRLECMRILSTSCNLIRNPRVNRRDDHREGRVDE